VACCILARTQAARGVDRDPVDIEDDIEPSSEDPVGGEPLAWLNGLQLGRLRCTRRRSR
jgi:hypothetical protein